MKPYEPVFRHSMTALIIVVVTVTLVVLGLMWRVLPKPSHRPAHAQEVAAAQAFVRARLPQGGEPKFSATDQTRVKVGSGGRVYVSGWASTSTSNGVYSRVTYSCTMHRSIQGEWLLDTVNMVPF